MRAPRAESISLDEARRIVLAAQRFCPRPQAPRTIEALADLVGALGAIQIDSVNVLVRSHYLPLFSRCGAYDASLLERAAYDPESRRLVEYWGHEASFLPLENYPLFRWRMERARRGEGTWGRLKKFATEHREAVNAVREQIRERGALGAGELSVGRRGTGGWWGWSEAKEILEWLFWTGEVTTARRRNFERLYDLTERVLPAEVLNREVPKDEAQRTLMTIAARALGIATATDLRDYFRLPTDDAAERIRELVEEGTLVSVAVEGWKPLAYRYRDAQCPRNVSITALLSPFDSLIWERQRTERLFGFHYRLEIYTPAHKRRHGYYVLPFLHEGRLVARVDLKSDRERQRLLVRGGSVEQGAREADIVEPLLTELQKLARWLDLETVTIASRRGSLMKALRRRS
ncbi:MAG TPA: crosslink repair DNA glycosylase YcaQ family protein [Steroidobacteraceae bacterium]